MVKLFTALLLILAWQTIPAVAETCDAGNGCRITCKDGCSAIYNHDTHQCSKACGKVGAATGAEESKVNASFRNMPTNQVDQMLGGMK